ncbi:hypothetical protein A8C75_08900 [Marinobacterium aestuarii]|uniref:Uncharacterized protein n=1 Tax=Marinobacterium aestuarii TaxID=1821621 RepID=A0A1A9EYJ4_9GAMM|nr:hypothetical protein A8C75_08900 [Marinobacterium aestuarii]
MKQNTIFAEMEAQRKQGQIKRGNNRGSSAHLLRCSGIVFTSKNEGAHLIVCGHQGPIDFWPGTGKWKGRKARLTGMGVRNLIENIKNGRL